MCAEPLARPVTARVGVDAVTAVDWIIVAFVALMALWGYAQGLVVSALSLAGFAVGAFAGSRLAPRAPRPGIELALRAPVQPRDRADGGRPDRDHLRGAGRGHPAADVIPRSGRARRHRRCGAGRHARPWTGVDRGRRRAPDAGCARAAPGHPALGDPLEAERGAAAVRPAPERPRTRRPVPRIRGPAADVPAPTRRILRDGDVQQAQASVVRVLGHACGLAVQGSGWVARPGVVVTNAHVVAGEDDTTVEVDGGDGMDATAVVFDPHNDVAVLSVPGLGAPALDQRTGARSGAPVAILGYPENGPYRSVAGPPGRDAHGAEPRRLRKRPGAQAHDLAARDDPVGQLGRAGRRLRRPGGRDGVRRDDKRLGRGLRRAAGDRRGGSRSRRAAGRHRALRALAGRGVPARHPPDRAGLCRSAGAWSRRSCRPARAR